MQPEKVGIIALTLVNVALFASSGKTTFRRGDQRLETWLIWLGVPTAWLVEFAAEALCMTSSPWRLLGAAALLVAAALLFVATRQTTRRHHLRFAFSRDLPASLVTEGPYRYVRHPFYCAYTMVYAAGAVACATPWMALVAALMAGIYWRAATLEEQNFARTTFGADYQAFRARTGMLVPNVLKLARFGRLRAS